MQNFLDELLKTSFFEEATDRPCQNERRKTLILGSMLLQQYYEEYEFTEKQKNMLASAIEYLTEAFLGKAATVNRKDVPALIYLAEIAQEKGMTPNVFLKWWSILRG